MSLLTRPTWTPIGVDVNGRFINAVQLRRRPGPLRVDAAASLRRHHPEAPIDEEELLRLLDVFDRQSFRGRDVVLAMPPEKVMLDVATAPRREADSGDWSSVRDELARRHKWEETAFELACWPLPVPRRRETSVKVMAAACPHDEATTFLDLCESVGLNVVAIDTQPLSLARSCTLGREPGNELYAVLDLEWSGAWLVMFSADTVVYVRSLDQAGLNRLESNLRTRLEIDEDLTEYITSRLDLESGAAGTSRSPRMETVRSQLNGFVDDLVVELRRSINYAAQEFPDTPVVGVTLAGSGAQISGLREAVAEGIGIPTEIGNPIAGTACRDDIRSYCDDPRLCAALGLALWS